MASDLIRKSRTLELLKYYERQYDGIGRAIRAFEQMETIDAVEVVHGEWKPRYHSYSNYNETVMIADEFCCSCCGVREKYKYNYCPNCGADMRVGRWKGEGMGDYSCSLCGEVVNGNHREECPNCHAKMDGGEKE